MSKKTTYMIVAGASVVVVRDGKRKSISAGGGFDFTDDEITAIKAGAPGSLRKPINEGRGTPAPDDADDAADADDRTVKTETKQTKTPAKNKAKAKTVKEPAASDADDGDDEDEDI